MGVLGQREGREKAGEKVEREALGKSGEEKWEVT